MATMNCIEIESSRIAWLVRDGYAVEECEGDDGERLLRVSMNVGADEAGVESAWFGVDVALDLPTEDYARGLRRLGRRVVGNYSRQNSRVLPQWGRLSAWKPTPV